jgi:tetratricopeptide (TPR) repeat protein
MGRGIGNERSSLAVTRKKITTKTDKKDDLDPMKDKFITKSASIFTWVVDRRQPIGIGVIGVLVITVGIIVVSSILESSRAEASSLLDKGFEAYLAPVIPAAEVPKDIKTKEPDLVFFETRKARAEEAQKRFAKAEADQDGEPIGNIARLGVAASQMDLGAFDKAASEYEAFLGAADQGSSWLKANALEGLGQALEAQGKLDEARKRYKELGDLGDGMTSLIGRYNEARIAILKGEKDAAKKTLKDILEAVKERGQIDALNYLFVASRELLLSIDPAADVPGLPSAGLSGLDGIDPEMLQQLIQAKQAAGAGAP